MPWIGLVAEFSDEPEDIERRRAVRRRLHFESILNSDRNPSKVVVFDLSEAGMMLHTTGDLSVGEIFELDLPEAGIVRAKVVWKRVTLFGCEFVTPVSKAAISAVLLKVAQHRDDR